jgi:S1-C subfamily serine protease
MAAAAVAAASTAVLPAGAVPPSIAKQLGNSVADAVEKVMPAVVVVRTEQVRYRLARDWYWGDVFGIPERLAGQGSGVIISKDGYILTNNHVIDDAQQIEVVLNDGMKYAAKLVGQDPHTDVAVVKIQDANGRVFTPIGIGDSDKLRVGEMVIAIGSPFSLSSSVTLGIVSQKGRAVGALPYEDFIQTDAAVNQGNSGGPLVDADGNMVGINTMIQTAGYSGGNIGITFAIPVNLAMAVGQSIIRTGTWIRPWIGIVMRQENDGVYVDELAAGSPAGKAGLAEGDRLTRLDDQPIVTTRDVQRVILQRGADQVIDAEVVRNGKSLKFKVKTARMTAPAAMFRRPN